MNQSYKKDFIIPSIPGISDKAMEIHLGLYAGYVKNLQAHYDTIMEVCKGGMDHTLVAPALTRRISFELAGVLNHMYFFETIEHGAQDIAPDSALHTAITNQFGTMDMFKKSIEHTATLMRGIGWVLTVYDTHAQMFHMLWVSDHELGNVNLPVIVALDMWEHAYMVDYEPKDKGKYVTAYLNAINWSVVEKRFDAIS